VLVAAFEVLSVLIFKDVLLLVLFILIAILVQPLGLFDGASQVSHG
jgi:hypothetical protein